VAGGLPGGRLGLQVPLFRAPAACWCARTTAESTLTSQAISPAASARVPATSQSEEAPSRLHHQPPRYDLARS
jgi:hypothetical protein